MKIQNVLTYQKQISIFVIHNNIMRIFVNNIEFRLLINTLNLMVNKICFVFKFPAFSVLDNFTFSMTVGHKHNLKTFKIT